MNSENWKAIVGIIAAIAITFGIIDKCQKNKRINDNIQRMEDYRNGDKKVNWPQKDDREEYNDDGTVVIIYSE